MHPCRIDFTRVLRTLVVDDDALAFQAAFRKLAYKRFMHVPLYLEWAPLDIFGEEGAQGAVEAPVSKHRAAKDGGESGAAVVTGDEDVADAEESSTLFVKNLNFDTTSESLEAAFKRRVSGVRSAKVSDVDHCSVRGN